MVEENAKYKSDNSIRSFSFEEDASDNVEVHNEIVEPGRNPSQIANCGYIFLYLAANILVWITITFVTMLIFHVYNLQIPLFAGALFGLLISIPVHYIVLQPLRVSAIDAVTRVQQKRVEQRQEILEQLTDEQS